MRRVWPTWTTCATRSQVTRCCCPCIDRRHRRCRAPSRVPSRSPTAGARASAPVPSPGSTRASPTQEYDCATKHVPTSPAPKALVSIIMQEAQIIPYKYANCTAVLLGRSFPRITHSARGGVIHLNNKRRNVCQWLVFPTVAHFARPEWYGASVINPAAHNWNHVLLVKNKFALCCAGLDAIANAPVRDRSRGVIIVCVCLCAPHHYWCSHIQRSECPWWISSRHTPLISAWFLAAWLTLER